MSPRTIDAAGTIAIAQDSSEFIHLLEFQFDTGSIYLATSAQPLLWNSHTWTAVGGHLDISGVEETTDAKGQGVDVKLSGVDQTVLGDLLNNKFHGRIVNIYRAYLDRNTGLVLSTLLLFQGLQLSAYTVDEKRDKTGGTVTISTRLSGWFGISRMRGITTNIVSHQAYFTGDTFFAHAATLANIKVYWGTPIPLIPAYGGFGPSGRPCFPAGTPILMANRTEKVIEAIELGDLVMSFDETDGSLEIGRVIGCMQHLTDSLVDVFDRTLGCLRVTPEHRIYTGNEFVAAGLLSKGSRIMCWNGTDLAPIEVSRVAVLPSKEIAVYNFEVAHFHTYIAAGIAVHNTKNV